jgi:hypothetical protein
VSEAFRLILDSVPNLRIVFSSTWRWPIHVNRLHEQWLEHGLPIEITIDGTPETREDPSIARIDLKRPGNRALAQRSPYGEELGGSRR